MLPLLLADRTSRAAGAAGGLGRDYHKGVHLGAGRILPHSAAAAVGIDRAGHREVVVHTGPPEVEGGRSHLGGVGRHSSAGAVADSHPAGAANVLGARYSHLAEEGKVSVRESG